jgi:hypothetical protein
MPVRRAVTVAWFAALAVTVATAGFVDVHVKVMLSTIAWLVSYAYAVTVDDPKTDYLRTTARSCDADARLFSDRD